MLSLPSEGKHASLIQTNETIITRQIEMFQIKKKMYCLYKVKWVEIKKIQSLNIFLSVNVNFLQNK